MTAARTRLALLALTASLAAAPAVLADESADATAVAAADGNDARLVTAMKHRDLAAVRKFVAEGVGINAQDAKPPRRRSTGPRTGTISMP